MLDYCEAHRSDSGQSWIENLTKKFSHDPALGVRKFIALLNQLLEKKAAGRNEFGTGPPCRNYRQLKAFIEFAQIDDLLMAAQSKLALDNVGKDWKDHKAAVLELITQSKAAAKRLEGALVIHSRTLSKASEAPKMAQPSRLSLLKASATAVTFFDGAAEFALPIPAATLSAEVVFTTPAIFAHPVEDVMKVAPALVQACQTVVTNLVGKPDKRVSRRLSDDPLAQAELLLKPILELHYKGAGGKVAPPSGLDMHFSPNLTWMAPDYKDQLSELNYLGTCRLQVLGSRKIVCTEALRMLRYLDKVSHQGMPQSVMKDVHSWLKTATLENGKNFKEAAGGPMYHATLGPGDALWLPPGWVYYDAAQAGKDKSCINVRVQTLATGHHDTMVELFESLKKRGKVTSTMLAQIVDKLVLAQE